MAVVHAALYEVLGQILATVLDPYAGLQVIEMAPVQLKELDEQDTKVGIGRDGIHTIVQLEKQTIDMKLVSLIESG